jgi:hypothetical protein
MANEFNKKTHLPHLVILEIGDDVSTTFERPEEFEQNGGIYRLDSAVIRNTKQHHFCATITCEKKEMGYDGLSFHRLVEMKWKHMINQDTKWSFEGSKNDNGDQIEWNFKKGYQLLLYYRVQ